MKENKTNSISADHAAFNEGEPKLNLTNLPKGWSVAYRGIDWDPPKGTYVYLYPVNGDPDLCGSDLDYTWINTCMCYSYPANMYVWELIPPAVDDDYGILQAQSTLREAAKILAPYAPPDWRLTALARFAGDVLALLERERDRSLEIVSEIKNLARDAGLR